MTRSSLLVLGGTRFVGRAVVEAALAAGWAVTVLNRGRSGPVTAGAVHVIGDRTDPATISRLLPHVGRWDAVVDTWSGDPWVVHDAAQAVAPRCDRYVFVSSRSVYREPMAGADESSPVVKGDPNARGAQYAEAKAGAESAVLATFGRRALVLRPGLILGPHENMGRLPWWLGRISRGGEVLAPGPADLGIQAIDARDLAKFALTGIENGLFGPYDVVSPAGTSTMSDLLRACVDVTKSDARLRWADPREILSAGIEPWTQLPVWLPPGQLHAALHESDVSRALTAGLRVRPLAETVADTWTWLCERGGVAPRPAIGPSPGLDPDVERRLLAR